MMAIPLLILLLSGVCIGWQLRTRQKPFRYDKMDVELEALRHLCSDDEAHGSDG